MAKIWIKGPDSEGTCCGCENKTSPCDSCTTCLTLDFPIGSLDYSTEERAQLIVDTMMPNCLVAIIPRDVGVAFFDPPPTIQNATSSYEDNVLTSSGKIIPVPDTFNGGYTSAVTQHWFQVTVTAGTTIIGEGTLVSDTVILPNPPNPFVSPPYGQRFGAVDVFEYDEEGDLQFIYSNFNAPSGSGTTASVTINYTFLESKEYVIAFHLVAYNISASNDSEYNDPTSGFEVTFSAPVSFCGYRAKWQNSELETEYVSCTPTGLP
jgi:hypothetical protein